MSYLYVMEPDVCVYIENRQVIAEKKDGLKTILPLEKLEGVVLFGNAHITSRCSIELLERGIPVTYISSNGSFYGRLESTKHVNIERQRKQFRCGDDEEFCIKMARQFIYGKIHNQIVVLRRYNRNWGVDKSKEAVNFMQIIKGKIEEAASIEQIMGYEGIVSKKYFEGLSEIISDEFAFKGRNKMPPKDPFNSLLSFGYTLLLYEAYTAIVNKGLHPYAGLMHKDKQGHPALASDIIEEWRPVLVDSLVLNLLQNGVFKKEDFIVNKENGGVYLEKKQAKLFITKFEEKLRTETSYISGMDSRMSFRRAIQFQVNALANAIEERDGSLYRSVRIR